MKLTKLGAVVAGVEVAVPDGWYVVASGMALEGDQAWIADDGVFQPVTTQYGLSDVSCYWLVIRKFVGHGDGI